jgi:quinol monooxygenase YgiN
LSLLEEVQAASRRDDGCLHYGYYTEITDPLSFIAVEEWRDNEALAAHLRQSHVTRLIAALPGLGDGRLEIAAHEVAASGPLPLPG